MLSHTQNYINRREVVANLIRFVDFGRANLVLEIGPGKGSITDGLLPRSKRIIAIEADDDLHEYLKGKYRGIDRKKMMVIHGDFLRYPLPSEPFIVVSNIPFNITADIIRKITSEDSMLQVAYLIVQKEAAIKFLGAPHAHSPLFSHLLNIHYTIKKLIDISKENYTPRPRYDTALISIERRAKPILAGLELMQFKDFLTHVFGCNKRTIKIALKTVMSNLQVKIILANLNLSESAEVKRVMFADWISIFKTFTDQAPERSFEKIHGSYKNLLVEQKGLKKKHRTRVD